MLYGDSAKPTQSDFGHPMTSLDPCQSSEDEGNVCKSASNSSRMLKSRKQNRNLQRTRVPQVVFFFFLVTNVLAVF